MAIKYSKFSRSTRAIARVRVSNLRQNVLAEVDRLLRCGAVDPDDHNRGLLLGVAVENIADRWLQGERKKADYRNLKHF